MSEDERTVDAGETTASGDALDAGPDVTVDPDGAPSTGPRDPDSAAASFFELDAQLDRPAASGESGDRRRGLVVDADRVDAAAVPAGYPLSTRTDRAVALTVDLGDETTTVYLAWPGDGTRETDLTRLLDAMGVELRDLYGRTVLVDCEDGHDVLVTPAERPRGADRRAGVVGGLAVVAAFLGLLAVTGAPGVVAAVVWALVTFVWLPYATYTDAWYARTHSDWTGGPVFWATLMALPVLNLPVGLVYLWRRSRATVLGE